MSSKISLQIMFGSWAKYFSAVFSFSQYFDFVLFEIAGIVARRHPCGTYTNLSSLSSSLSSLLSLFFIIYFMNTYIFQSFSSLYLCLYRILILKTSAQYSLQEECRLFGVSKSRLPLAGQAQCIRSRTMHPKGSSQQFSLSSVK